MSASAIQRPSASEFLAYYGRYIDLVPEGDILTVLAEQGQKTTELLGAISDEKSLFRYGPDKWSIRELVGHITDAERIFSDRALRFARNDPQDQPGFEENDYVKNGGFDEVPFRQLIDGLAAVRRSSIALLANVTLTAAKRSGKANGAAITVQALAYVIVGHELHHLGILKSRYLNMK